MGLEGRAKEAAGLPLAPLVQYVFCDSRREGGCQASPFHHLCVYIQLKWPSTLAGCTPYLWSTPNHFLCETVPFLASVHWALFLSSPLQPCLTCYLRADLCSQLSLLEPGCYVHDRVQGAYLCTRPQAVSFPLHCPADGNKENQTRLGLEGPERSSELRQAAL